MSKVPLHSRVALKDGADQVYIYALAGTEGWVRGTKEDPDGFELFRIEWDKDHWRYNGQPDGWTFAEHFKVIGPPDPKTEQEPEPDEDPELEDVEMGAANEEGDLDAFMEALSEAFDSASEGEGFLVLSIRRMQHPEVPTETAFVPQLFKHAVTKEADMLLDVQLAELASTNYQEMVLGLLQAMKGTMGTMPDGPDE